MQQTSDVAETVNHSNRKLLLAVLGVIGLVALGLSAWFWHVWQNGDGKAAAFAGWLSFIAAAISSSITIVYVFFTYTSLRKAQQTIDLQQEQLKQMKASLSLQQQQWEQKTSVVPQFWIETFDEARWHRRHPDFPNTNQLIPLQFGRRFQIAVWNYSEQSFLVETVGLQRADVAMVPNQHFDSLHAVIKPHSVETIDVSNSIMLLLTQSMNSGDVKGLFDKDLDQTAKILARLTYTDWSHRGALTNVREFEFLYRPYSTDITIRTPEKPSHVKPSI
ncbi:hypothetical protein [Terracidiphilus gabretensis]|uniref:hypothetical protein n=1 Tax=Terracidiphilus gabretensis TaxID=1577687 RepID=UPI00071BC344|nr:hypothetical protein [Terracidiphilus gabretensis]